MKIRRCLSFVTIYKIYLLASGRKNMPIALGLKAYRLKSAKKQKIQYLQGHVTHQMKALSLWSPKMTIEKINILKFAHLCAFLFILIRIFAISVKLCNFF